MENKTERPARRRFEIAIVICIVLVLSINGCLKKKNVSVEIEKKKRAASEKGALNIEQEVYTFKVKGYDANRKVRWGLEGESANVVGDKINISNLSAVYYGDEMTLNLVSENAVYDKKTQNIELKGNIVGKTSDGGELMTDYAKWNADREEITSDSHVVIKRQNIVCKGIGLVTKPRIKQVTFNKEVDVDFSSDKRILCDGPFEIDYDKNKAVFKNNVTVIDKKGKMFVDELVVYIDPETKKVTECIF